MTRDGQLVRYIETTKADIQLADRLVSQVLGRSLDELPPGTRRLLDAPHGYVTARCEAEGKDADLVRFTRRQLREALPFGDTQLKVHLARLADYELVTAHRTSGGGFCYELAWHPAAPDQDAPAAVGRAGPGEPSPGPGRPPVGPGAGCGRAPLAAVNGQFTGHASGADYGDRAGTADTGRGDRQVVTAAAIVGGAR